jgi:hypothetical protein
MDDPVSLPIFHNPSLAVALLDYADAGGDDHETQTAAAERFQAREALLETRRAHAMASRIAIYPKKDLAVLQGRVTRAETAADDVSARLRAAADRRLRRAQTARTAALQRAMATPPSVDPVVDRLDRTERLRRLEALDPAERHLMLTTAAREGSHPELLRAALTMETPPWPTKSWTPLLPDSVAEEVREWIMARGAPESVQDVRTAWRLRRLADDLELDRRGARTTPAPPTLEGLRARTVRS